MIYLYVFLLWGQYVDMSVCTMGYRICNQYAEYVSSFPHARDRFVFLCYVFVIAGRPPL